MAVRTKLFVCFVRNNAGVAAIPFMLSKDNIEMLFATNYLGFSNAIPLVFPFLSRETSPSSSSIFFLVINMVCRSFSFDKPVVGHNEENSSGKWQRGKGCECLLSGSSIHIS